MLMLQHLVRVALLSENSATAPSGSPKAAVADAKIRGREKEDPWNLFQKREKL